jgi:ABC-type uncharacterized transport system ATPase subunit
LALIDTLTVAENIALAMSNEDPLAELSWWARRGSNPRR